MALTVTVGRNVKNVFGTEMAPMHIVEWLGLKDEVLVTVEKYVGRAYFKGEGIGWSEEWGLEEAFTVIAREPQYGDIRRDLDEELAKVGRFYGQEAVAVTVGTTVFV